jgi:hypothetical protein
MLLTAARKSLCLQSKSTKDLRLAAANKGVSHFLATGSWTHFSSAFLVGAADISSLCWGRSLLIIAESICTRESYPQQPKAKLWLNNAGYEQTPKGVLGGIA